jgi:hypothetical protein
MSISFDWGHWLSRLDRPEGDKGLLEVELDLVCHPEFQTQDVKTFFYDSAYILGIIYG